jgi:hypothetical protein
MRGRIAIGFGILMLTVPGCASTSDARYVYQDGEFGVVAIPRNTDEGPNHYRQQAEALMAHHFPQGYEIVRAEEVVEGSRTLTVGKSGTTELSPQVTPHLLALLKLGATMTRSQADTLALRECRIIYKKADPHSGTTSGGFAVEPSLTPTCYVDPKTESKKSDKEPVKAAQTTNDQQAARPVDRLVGE